MKQEEIINKAAAHWSAVTQSGSNKVLRWWQSPRIWIYINNLLDPNNIQSDAHGGFHRLLQKQSASGKFQRGVSVGCGTGEKEMKLVKSGVVEYFELYEISSERISHGLLRAAKLGVADKVRFIQGDAFRTCIRDDFDLVYWNNSLHHMLNIEQAITWSLERLSLGGYLRWTTSSAHRDFNGRTEI